MERLLTAIIAIMLGIVTVVVLNLSLTGGETAAMLLINKSDNALVWVSEQALMWMFFYLGLGELVLRFLASSKEGKQTKRNLLPEEDSVILTSKELPAVYTRAKQAGSAYLPRLIQRVVRQFQISQSADQANSVLDSSMELFLHEIDLKYNMLRYIMWVIPTIGFIGTVRGIALGLSTAAAESHKGNTDDLLYVVSTDLAVAFYTTMLALVMSGVLVLIMHICQGREEGGLNRSGQYCIDHLINKLYNPQPS
ncbi:MotA/TolQ/ExbB proton channel family protein [Verrucomicrobiaceae bacterium N1E253]|uniref:MotA/TolQ/ExbB proton channel family protein n=1 Tax=Oceaniferula marina TaxID=2748318 RepID=A0A851GA37_9BACT|nr:MotA/TolQ/ExbB proton channel family protein [Oceaniferula marina]NWK54079.1 MotA/TolQ/ExbB proton channel family protein [Oceaniferula marina]